MERNSTGELVTKCSTAFALAQTPFQKEPSAWQSVDDLKQCIASGGLDLSDDGRAWAQPEGKPTCMDCWVDNVFTDRVLCQEECLDRFINPGLKPYEEDACLQCDEYTAGPAFIRCAGLNRRSAGILSDIPREAAATCPSAYLSHEVESKFRLPDTVWRGQT
jgi:hypothetical protein